MATATHLITVAEYAKGPEERGAFYTELRNDRRVADVAYLSASRLKATARDGYFQGLPEFVAEVLFPVKPWRYMAEKRALCLNNGGKEFWVVDYDERRVEVSHRNGHADIHVPGDSIPLTFFDSGSVQVDGIFADFV